MYSLTVFLTGTIPLALLFSAKATKGIVLLHAVGLLEDYTSGFVVAVVQLSAD
jgi:hypothetical protein